MQLRLEVAWVAGGNLGSYRALGRVTASCVSFMLHFSYCKMRWRAMCCEGLGCSAKGARVEVVF